MTAGLVTGPGVRRRSAPLGVPVVPAAMALVVALRLLLVGRPASTDGGGFLVVASQWRAGGSSLYGDYWVDRPPLLIAIFQLADAAGGLVPLRVIGAFAAATTVGLLASTARRAFGQRAAGWTAVVAAALLISPLVGSDAVNGELLAMPFIALGIRLAVEAVRNTDPGSARAAATGAGVAAVLALLVKQNMADAVVFAAVLWLVVWRTGRMPGRTCADLFARAAVGMALGYVVVMLWAMAHGTTPWAVFEATYPFRLDAGRVLLESANELTRIRLGRLALSAVLSGAVVVLLAFFVLAGRRAGRDPVLVAIAATAGFATVSIGLGGSYWLHYLVEAVPAVALAAGALSVFPRRSSARLTPLVAAAVVVSATVALLAVVNVPEPAPGAVIGGAVAGSAKPGDTIISAFGEPDILHVTGMSSPYPYLWSLPSRTLDPDMSELREVLAGPDAPTWIVVRGSRTLDRLEAHGVRAMIEARYRMVGTVCARSVYLQRGLVRPELAVPERCGGLVLP